MVFCFMAGLTISETLVSSGFLQDSNECELSSSQLATSQLFQSFFKQATDGYMLCGMVAGGIFGTATKAYCSRLLSSVSFFQKSAYGSMGAQVISSAAACMTEAVGMHSLPEYLRGTPTLETKFSEGLKGWAHTTLTIMLMKTTGCILPANNIALQHISQDVLMVGLDSVCVVAGLTEASQGSFFEKVCSNEVINWQMMASGCLVRQVAPAVAMYEAKFRLNFELSKTSKGSRFSFGFGFRSAEQLVTPEGILMSASEVSGGKEAEARKTHLFSVSNESNDWHGIPLGSSEGGVAISSESATPRAKETLDAYFKAPHGSQEYGRAIDAIKRDPEAARVALIGRSDIPPDKRELLSQVLYPGLQTRINPHLRRVLVVNRGEIAVKITQGVLDYAKATGEELVPMVVYSDAEIAGGKELSWMRRVREMGGELVSIGGLSPKESYINHERILEAASKAGADALHPGYGFLAENEVFAERVYGAGYVWLGPPVAGLRKAGNKLATKQAWDAAGLPIVPGTIHQYSNVEGMIAEIRARGLSYPLRIKAVAGGSGMGQFNALDEGQLRANFPTKFQEAQNAFGLGDMLAEGFVSAFRHIEFQVRIDTYGNGVSDGERECTLQVGGSKIVEMHPALDFVKDPALREELRRKAIRAAMVLGLTSHNTVEGMLTPDGNFFFMEDNPRIQVEHVVTEAVTGVNLIGEAIRVGKGLPLSSVGLPSKGAAVEVRINAVMPGPMTRFRILGTPEFHHLRKHGVIVYPTYTEGDVVSAHSNPLIAKLVVRGETREDAIEKMQFVLRSVQLTGEKGFQSNLLLLQNVFATRFIRRGDYTNQTIERWKAAGGEDLTLSPYRAQAFPNVEPFPPIYLEIGSDHPISAETGEGIGAEFSALLRGETAPLKHLKGPIVERLQTDEPFRASLATSHTVDRSLQRLWVQVNPEGHLLQLAAFENGQPTRLLLADDAPLAHLPTGSASPAYYDFAFTREGDQFIPALHYYSHGQAPVELSLSAQTSKKQRGQLFQIPHDDAEGNRFTLELIPAVGQTLLQVRDKRGNLFFSLVPHEANVHPEITYAQLIDRPPHDLPEYVRERVLARNNPLLSGIAELPSNAPARARFIEEMGSLPRSLISRLLEMVQETRTESERTLLDEVIVRRKLREKRQGEEHQASREVVGYQRIDPRTSLTFFAEENGHPQEPKKGRLMLHRWSLEGSCEKDLLEAAEIVRRNSRVGHEQNVIELVVKRPYDSKTGGLLSDEATSDFLATAANAVFTNDLVAATYLKRVTFTVIDPASKERLGNPPTYFTYRRTEDLQRFVTSLAGTPKLSEYQPQLLGQVRGGVLSEDRLCRGYHPLVGHHYLRLGNLALFPKRERDSLHSDVSSHVFYVEHPQKKDRRMFGRSIVSEARVIRTADGTLQEIPEIRTRFEALLDVMKKSLQSRPKEQQPGWNQAHVEILPPLPISAEEFTNYSERLAKQTEKDGRLKGLRLQKTTVRGLIQDPQTGECQPIITEIANPTGYQFVHNLKYVVQGNVILEEGERAVKREVHLDPFNYSLWKKDPLVIFSAGSYQLADQPILPRDEVGLREEREVAKAGIFAARIPSVARLSARKFRESLGIQSPQDLLDRSQSVPEGIFIDHEVEYDFDPASIRKNPKTGQIDYFSGELVPAVEKDGTSRLPGKNKAGVVVAVSYRDLGLERPFPVVMMIGDLTRNGGALDPETSARKNGALALARKLSRQYGFEVPVESVSASPGADVNAETGVEHLDGIASHLGVTNRYIAEEQGPIHEIVYRYVVGGAAYDTARRTMLLDTAGLNVFVRDTGTAILTGPGAQIIAYKPTLKSWDIDGEVKRSYPEGTRSMGGYREIYGRNGEGMIGTQDLSEAFDLLNRAYYYTALRRPETLIPLRRSAPISPIDPLTFVSGPSFQAQLLGLAEGKRLRPAEVIALFQQSSDAAALNLRLASGATLKETLEQISRGQEVNPQEIIDLLRKEHPKSLALSRTVKDELIAMIGNRPPWNMQAVMDAFRDPGSPPEIRLWGEIEDLLGKVPPEHLPTVRGDKNRIGGILRKPPNIQVRIQQYQGRSTLWIALSGALTPLDSEIYTKAVRKADLLGLPVINLNAGNPFYMADPQAMIEKQLTWGASLQDAVSRLRYPYLCVDLSSLIGGYMVSVSKQLRRPEEQGQHRIIAIRHENLITAVRVVGANIYTNIVARGEIARRAEKDPRVQEAKKISDEKYQEALHQVIGEIEVREGEKYNAAHTTQRALEVGAIDDLVDLKDLYSSMVRHFNEAVAAHQTYSPTRQGLELSRHAERSAELPPEETARRLLQGFINSGSVDPHEHARQIAERLLELARGGKG